MSGFSQSQRNTGGPRSASATARSLKNAKRKRDSAQPQEREAQARQRAASRTRSASATARSLKKITAGIQLILRKTGAHRAPLQQARRRVRLRLSRAYFLWLSA